MVVDEAHFIKNLTSQRSQQVLALADRLRATTPGGNPLLLALTGTPLINDVKDFDAIWRFLGWIKDGKPVAEIVRRLDETGYSPADRGFYPEARRAVIDMGIVRRRKVDVASDLPEKRIADITVELDDALGQSIRKAERAVGERLAKRYAALLSEERGVTDSGSRARVRARRGADATGRRCRAQGGHRARRTPRTSSPSCAGSARPRPNLAADYAAQLSHSVGKVVFFAKHIDVMDTAERVLAEAGLRTVSVRGEQTAKQRQDAIDAFQGDPEVAVAVCSLTAAGVGLNLHAASNVVLAELSWTAAEQGRPSTASTASVRTSRSRRGGSSPPSTIDSKIAELIDAKQGLAARALDGSDVEVAGR